VVGSALSMGSFVSPKKPGAEKPGSKFKQNVAPTKGERKEKPEFGFSTGLKLRK